MRGDIVIFGFFQMLFKIGQIKVNPKMDLKIIFTLLVRLSSPRIIVTTWEWSVYAVDIGWENTKKSLDTVELVANTVELNA